MSKMISFFEIPSVDFCRAVKFYETILKTDLVVCECGEDEKMAGFLDENGRACGDVFYNADFLPSQQGVIISLRTENMEGTLHAIVENGGKIIRPKTKIEAEGMGYFALFIDCEGNKLGLYSDR